MNKKQIDALKQANKNNEVIAQNELLQSAAIQETAKELKDKEVFNEGQTKGKQHKPNSNVSAETIDLAKESRTIIKADVKRLTNTFDYKMNALLTVCETANGQNYLKQNNLKIDDITKKQILKTLTSLVVNGKNLHVRIIPLKADKSNILTADLLAVKLSTLDEKGVLVAPIIETVEIKYSVLDRNYIFEQNEQNELILTKGKTTYTFSVVETLNYNIIIDRLASYRKIANIQATKKLIQRQDEKTKVEKAELLAKAKAEKAEKEKAKVLASFSKDELLELAKQAEQAA